MQENVGRFAARPGVRQFLRFAAVGAVATAAHYTTMIGLKELARVGVVLATTCGYGLGALVGYTLNRTFTFEVRPAFGQGLMKYLLVVVTGLFINASIVAALTSGSAFFAHYYMLAQMLATGLVLIWNFAGSRLFVFR